MEDDLLNSLPIPFRFLGGARFCVCREVVANVLSSDKSISRRLLYFLKCSYVIGPYRMGGGNKWGVYTYSSI